MKKILLLTLIAVACFYFYGCKKGYDDAASTNTLILGRWAHVSDSILTYHNDTLSTRIEPVTTDTVQFDKGGLGNDGTTNFTYDLRGYFLTLKYPAYTYNNVSYPAVNYESRLRSITKTKMVIFYDLITKDSIGRANGSVVYATYLK